MSLVKTHPDFKTIYSIYVPFKDDGAYKLYQIASKALGDKHDVSVFPCDMDYEAGDPIYYSVESINPDLVSLLHKAGLATDGDEAKVTKMHRTDDGRWVTDDGYDDECDEEYA
jgi:hypothetical protein